MCSPLLIARPPLPSIIQSLKRTLSSVPSFSPSASGVKTYNDQKLFPYKAKELYAIVSDVASYPRFIPFCIDSRIDLSAQRKAMQEKTVVDAELTVEFLDFKESYFNVVTSIPFKSVEATASSSTPLFKTLSTTWQFQSHPQSPTFKSEDGSDPSDPPGPTLVSFTLAFQFATRNPIHHDAALSSLFFGRVSKLMLKAFEDRCLQVYGPRSLIEKSAKNSNMAYQYSRKSCFKCGSLGHIAENCSFEQRLCFNCRQPGHESSACPSPRTAKQCYSCGGVGHAHADCPTLRVKQESKQKYYNGRIGHFASNCQNGPTGNSGFSSRSPPPGRALNTSTLPPVMCYRCGGPNHLARDCLATPGTLDSIPTGPAANKAKTCYKCQQEGHIARDCPEKTEKVE